MEDKSKVTKYILFFMTGMFLTGFMLVSSLATSPLYPNNYSYDSAFFRFIGAEILKGKTPYTDVWDHKGPVLFFIQALGAAGGTKNKGTNVLFLIQLLSAYLSVFFLYKTYALPGGKRRPALTFCGLLVCVLAVFSLTIESGNLTEEWCLPMTCCSFYLFMKYGIRASGEPAHPLRTAFWHGICLGLMAMIRINNALPVCAGLAVIGFYLIRKKLWRNLLCNFLCGILGIACIILPVTAWFYFRGALEDMIYAAFTFNIEYSQIRSFVRFSGADFITRYLPAGAAILIFLLHLLRTRHPGLPDLILAAVLGTGIWMMCDTNVYLHYFTVFVPILFLVLIRCTDRIRIPEAVILLILLGWFSRQNVRRIPDLISLHRQQQMFRAAEQIPPEERDSVIAVNMPVELYLNYGLEPVSRFVTNQHVHFSIDPDMKTEFLETLDNRKPLWILADCRGETKIPEVQDLIDRLYRHRFDESGICYYRLR